MTTILAPHSPSDDAWLSPDDLFPGRKRWTHDECVLLERYGIIKERYELLDGEILIKHDPRPSRHHRFTRADCDFLERLGVLSGRYELIDGEVISKMGQDRPHAIIVALLIDWLISVFGGRYVLCQSPIEVGGGDQPTYQPEPDASVLANDITTYVNAAPGPLDVRLVVEVSDATLLHDLRVKAGLYARAGIAEYWVIDATGRRLLAHYRPVNGAYAEVIPYSENDSIAPLAAPNRFVRVADLLPPLSPSEIAAP